MVSRSFFRIRAVFNDFGPQRPESLGLQAPGCDRAAVPADRSRPDPGPPAEGDPPGRTSPGAGPGAIRSGTVKIRRKTVPTSCRTTLNRYIPEVKKINDPQKS